jgi:hypothetical protein
VGGGTSVDLDYIPQTFPDPNSPNNVLAPLWTDIDVSDGGAIRAGYLTDGVTDWFIIDWDGVPTYGTGGAEAHSFEIWIQVSTTAGESVTYEIGNVTGTGSSDGTNVGAENRDGSSGVNLGFFPSDGDSYTITAGTPTAGGSVDITYDAVGKKVGLWAITARLETDVTPGVTTAVVNISVT